VVWAVWAVWVVWVVQVVQVAVSPSKRSDDKQYLTTLILRCAVDFAKMMEQMGQGGAGGPSFGDDSDDDLPTDDEGEGAGAAKDEAAKETAPVETEDKVGSILECARTKPSTDDSGIANR
jgi:hypothetical protein